MHTIPPFKEKIFLYDRNWKVIREYRSLEEARTELIGPVGNSIANVGEHFRQHIPSTWGDWHEPYKAAYVAENDYILRTDLGDIITIEQIRAAFTHKKYRWQSYWELRRQFNFRSGPVPTIGHTRGRWRHVHRYIRTMAERRAADRLIHDQEMKDYGIKPRASRGIKNLPNSWDDIPRSNYSSKNWKKHRRTQWRD